MIDPSRAKGVVSESAILVSVALDGQPSEAEPLEELSGLAESAGATIVGQLTQRRQVPDATTYLGKGKAEELRDLCDQSAADVVIFDNDLNPAQGRNLEKLVKCRVIDRTQLILDIFASRARTYEACLAVELAQLQYSLPRLKRLWTHLSRIKAGIGMRGPGEKQLEEDRRLVERRIHELQTELRTVEKRRERQVAARHDHMTVSLVGYTNAGKSTLMNGLTDAGVLAKDMLFATLDTRTRRWQLPGWGPVLLSDTVGFIRDLPHHLIASFRATLEETRQANLLLHVADAANPAVFEQITAVYHVIEELGIQAKDTLLVLNKVDGLTDRARLDALMQRYPHAIPVSARTRQGLDQLALAVSDALSRTFLNVEVEVPVGDGRTLAYLAANGEILSSRYGTEQVVIHCRLPEQHAHAVTRFGALVRPHQAAVAGNQPLLDGFDRAAS